MKKLKFLPIVLIGFYALVPNLIMSQTVITIDACSEAVSSLNVVSWEEPNGFCHLQNTDGTPRNNAVQFFFVIPQGQAGIYAMSVRYAARDSRPVNIFIDGSLRFASVLRQRTLTWNVGQSSISEFAGSAYLSAGQHILRIERNAPFPHISKIVFTKS